MKLVYNIFCRSEKVNAQAKVVLGVDGWKVQFDVTNTHAR